MRHRKTVKKLGRTASHRKAMLRNMASAIIEHRQIKTTLTKAKAAQAYIERLITYGKKDTVHARRLAFKFLQNRTHVKTLFDDIAPTFKSRNGGYTRVIKLGERKGDAAAMAILQLVGFEKLIVDDGASKKKSKPKKSRKAASAPAAAASTATVVDDAPAEETVEEKDASVEEKPDAVEETAKEEKPVKAKKEADKAGDKSGDEAAETEKPAEEAADEEEKKPEKDDKKES